MENNQSNMSETLRQLDLLKDSFVSIQTNTVKIELLLDNLGNYFTVLQNDISVSCNNSSVLLDQMKVISETICNLNVLVFGLKSDASKLKECSSASTGVAVQQDAIQALVKIEKLDTALAESRNDQAELLNVLDIFPNVEQDVSLIPNIEQRASNISIDSFKGEDDETDSGGEENLESASDAETDSYIDSENESNELKCVLCCKTFNSTSAMKYHMKSSKEHKHKSKQCSLGNRTLKVSIQKIEISTDDKHMIKEHQELVPGTKEKEKGKAQPKLIPRSGVEAIAAIIASNTGKAVEEISARFASVTSETVEDKNLDTAHRSRSTPIRKQVQSSTPLERFEGGKCKQKISSSEDDKSQQTKWKFHNFEGGKSHQTEKQISSVEDGKLHQTNWKFVSFEDDKKSYQTESSYKEPIFPCIYCGKKLTMKTYARYHIKKRCKKRPPLDQVDWTKVEAAFNEAIEIDFKVFEKDEDPEMITSNKEAVSVRLASAIRETVDGIECIKCGQKLSSLEESKSHTKLCGKEPKYPCIYCSKKFINMSAARYHIKVRCRESPPLADMVDWQRVEAAFKEALKQDIQVCEKAGQNDSTAPELSCEECGKAFLHKQSLVTHLKIHANKRRYECKHCDMTYKKERALKEHYKKFQDGSCKDYCLTRGGKTFIAVGFVAERLKQGLIKVNGDSVDNRGTTYPCRICKAKFEDKDEYLEHYNAKACEEPAPASTTIRCKKCKRNFEDRAEFLEHYNANVCELNRTQCKSCGETFLSPEDLLSHRKVSHREGYEACKACGKWLASKHMYKHMYIHTGQMKKYTCEYCEKVFIWKSSFNRHVAVHVGRRDYICHVCGKGFMTPHTLKSHVQGTHGEAKYKCDVCDLKFKRQGALYQHRKVHTVNKGVVCEVCGEVLRQPQYLKQHMTKHTGERPHKCHICGEGFAWHSGRARHIRVKHTGKRPYTCPHCPRAFFDDAGRKQHAVRCLYGDRRRKAYRENKDKFTHLQSGVPLQTETSAADFVEDVQTASMATLVETEPPPLVAIGMGLPGSPVVIAMSPIDSLPLVTQTSFDTQTSPGL